MITDKNDYIVLECSDCKTLGIPKVWNGKLTGKRLRFAGGEGYVYIPKYLLIDWLSNHESCEGEMRIIKCNKPILEQLKEI
jgi:hypothetical protein